MAGIPSAGVSLPISQWHLEEGRKARSRIFMARLDSQLSLHASILDRIIDPDSDGTGSKPGCTVEQMIDSVRRDLEDLLNTHRTLMTIPSGYTETENSILTYGLPDFSSFQSSKQDVS